MSDEEKEPSCHKTLENTAMASNGQPPKVSKIIFDEDTGTITLKLASKQEIAEAEGNKK